MYSTRRYFLHSPQSSAEQPVAIWIPSKCYTEILAEAPQHPHLSAITPVGMQGPASCQLLKLFLTQTRQINLLI